MHQDMACPLRNSRLDEEVLSFNFWNPTVISICDYLATNSALTLTQDYDASEMLLFIIALLVANGLAWMKEASHG